MTLAMIDLLAIWAPGLYSTVASTESQSLMLPHEIIFRTLLGGLGLFCSLWGLPGVRQPGMSCVLTTNQEVPKKFICMKEEGGLASRRPYGASQLAP